MDLICQPTNNLWAADKENPIAIPIISRSTVHPGPAQDVARVWTAAKAGRIKVAGSLCNMGNPAGGEYGFRAGSSTYAPWYALYGRDTQTRPVHRLGLLRALGLFVRVGRRRRGQCRIEGRRSPPDPRPGRIGHDSQGLRWPLPGRPRQRGQRVPGLAIPLSLGLHSRGWFPAIRMRRVLDKRNHLGQDLVRQRRRISAARTARCSGSPT